MDKGDAIRTLLELYLGASLGAEAGSGLDHMLQPVDDAVAGYLNINPDQRLDSAPITSGLGALTGGLLAYKLGHLSRRQKNRPG